MRGATLSRCLDLGALKYVAENNSTREELLDWYGPSGVGCFYSLYKAGVLEEGDGRIRLAEDHLLEGGRRFWWPTEPGGASIWLLDFENDVKHHVYGKHIDEVSRDVTR